MDTAKFIDSLKREQAQLALASLLSPKGRDAFELGLITGQVQAYERVLSLLNDQLNEAEGKPAPKPVSRSLNPYLADLDSAPLLPEQYRSR